MRRGSLRQLRRVTCGRMRSYQGAEGPFVLRHEDEHGIAVVVVQGALDFVNVPALHAGLAAFDADDGVLLDLTLLDFIDSSGLGELLTARERIGNGLHLGYAADGPVSQLLEVTGLTSPVKHVALARRGHAEVAPVAAETHNEQ